MKNKKSFRFVPFVLAVVIATSTQFSTPALAAEKNSPPVFTQGNSLSVSTPTNKPCTSTISAKDSNGDALTFAVSTAPKSGTVTLAAPTSKGKGSARIYSANTTYRPKSGFTGSDFFGIIAKDSKGAKSSVITIKVTVQNSDKASNNSKSVTVLNVVSPKYDAITGFKEGMAIVSLNNKIGFVDLNGKEVVPVKYDNGDGFFDGLARVKLGGKWGFVDKTGKEIISPKYDEAENFSDGVARVEFGGKKVNIDKTGKEIAPSKYDEVGKFYDGLAWVKLGDKTGYIDKIGKEVVPLGKYYRVGKYSEGIAWFQPNDPTDKSYHKYGFIDKEGNIIAEPKYDFVADFSEGLAVVSTGNYYGYIDKTGKEVIPQQFYYLVTSFSEGLAIAYVDGKPKIIDKTGKVVADIGGSGRYYGFGPFVEGRAWIYGTRSTPTPEYGYIDKTGKIVVPCNYSTATNFSNGFAQVSNGDSYGIIDKTGKEIIPTMYGSVAELSEGVFIAQGHYSPNFPNWIEVFDKTGKIVVPGGIYIGIGSFTDGLSRVTTKNGMIGIINTNGKEVVKTGKYKSIGEFIDGIATVQVYLGASGTYHPDKYRWGAIDKTGKEVIPATRTYPIGNFNNGLALINSNNKYGFIDITGKEVLPPTLKYDSITPVSDKMYAVELNGKWGFITVRRN